MNTRTIRIVLLFAALAVGVVGITAAREDSMSIGKGVPIRAVPFTMTTVFSGPLTGEILVNGQSVFINAKTTFHKVGVGPIEAGETVNNTAIFIGGVMKGKKAIATMVLIGEPEMSADFSETTIPTAEHTGNDAQ